MAVFTVCYYKMRQVLLQNATAILLQNATEIYYKMHHVFLLENATVVLQKAAAFTNYNSFITKFGSYYKMRRLLPQDTHKP